MSFALDIRTIIYIFSLALILQALSMQYLRLVHTDYAPASLWARGSLTLALGMFLLSLEKVIPALLATAVANCMILGGQMLLNFGVCLVAGRQPPWRKAWTMLAICFSIFTWTVTAGRESVSLEHLIFIFSAFAIPIQVHIVYVCLSTLRQNRRISFLVLGILNLILLCTLSYRLIAVYQSGIAELFQATSGQLLLYGTGIFYVFLSSVMFAVLTGEHLQTELRLLAMRDPLTQTLNRRAFAELAERDWARALRHQHPICTMMLDIDHFKEINDEYGHAAGDSVLIKVAQEIQNQLRQNDILARYGGEEFAILLPDTRLNQAQEVAERIRSHVASLTVPELKRALTISIGLANHRDESNWDSLLRLADQALYRAKQGGRNRVSLG